MKLSREHIPEIGNHVCWTEEKLEAYFEKHEKGRGYVPLIEILDDETLRKKSDGRESDIDMLFHALCRMGETDPGILRDAVFALEPRHLEVVSPYDVFDSSRYDFEDCLDHYAFLETPEERLAYLRSIV